MPDQADELRRFVAEQILPVTALDHAAAMAELDELINGTPGEVSPPTRGHSVLAGVMDELAKLSSLPPETAEVYRAKLMEPDYSLPFWERAAKARKRWEWEDRQKNPGELWSSLEVDLERWLSVGGFDKPAMSNEALAEFWEMMQRRKEQR